ncbi:MAG: pitrilysin family protein [Bacteroidia bacterium]
MKKQIITAALMAVSALVFAQTKPAAPAAAVDPATQPQLVEKVTAKPGEMIISYEKWKLPNGLQVIVHEDHSDPIAHVEVTYHVGSARETPGKSGFAHFFEHMMFQGSEHVQDEEHFKIVEGAGGDMNGTTNRDRTNYFETLPKNYLETALWLEADRMGFLLDSVTQTKFEVQRKTVKNEKDQRVNNVPYGRTDEVKNQILYPARHPYNWPTIGYVEDLDRVNVEDLKNFFMRWYGPNNASLVVAGDVSTKEVIDLAMKYFGPIPRGPEVRKQRVEPVRLPDNVYANYGDNIVVPLTYSVYPSVPNYHPDEAPLDILASILGDGNNSIMYKNLVKTEKALQVNAFNFCSELAGEFSIQFVSYPMSEVNPEEEMKKVFEEFDRIGVNDDDLKRAKGTFETQMISTLSSVASKASLLSLWNYSLPNKPMNLNMEIDRYNKVTKEDVMRVFRQYIKGKYSATVNVFAKPKDAATAGAKEETKLENSSGVASSELEYKGLTYIKPVDNFDRTKRPEVKGGVAPVVPAVYKHKFENGLTLMGTQTSELPMVTILMNIRGGNLVTNDPSKAGLAALTASMMEESTEKYTSEQFSNELAKLGSSISFSGGKENSAVTIVARKENLDATLKLLEEKLLHPKFMLDEFKLNQKRLAEQINSNRVQAGDMAAKAYARLLYGKSIAAEPGVGTIKTLKSMSVKDVQNYYDKYYSPSMTSVVVVGDVAESEILPKLNFLKTWARKEVTMVPVTGAPLPEKQQVYLVDKYKASQTEIRIGYMALPYDYNGKYYKSTVMNYPLGGNFNSRLNLNLREEKGITYGIRSGFSGSKNAGPFTVSVAVRATATDTALKEIMSEMKKYRENGITDSELDYARKSLSQGDALRYESPFAKAGFISTLAYFDLPTDYVDQQSKLLQTLKKEEINNLAKEMLPYEKMIIIMVGDKEKIQSNIEKLGYKVVDYKLD